jgi:hypothetical protein
MFAVGEEIRRRLSLDAQGVLDTPFPALFPIGFQVSVVGWHVANPDGQS